MSTHPHVIKTPPRTTAIAWTVAVLALVAVTVLALIDLTSHGTSHGTSSPPAVSPPLSDDAITPTAPAAPGHAVTPDHPAAPTHPVTPNHPSTPSGTPSAAVKTLQQQLGQLNYYEGPINGLMTSETAQSIQYLQRDAGLPQTGKMNAATQAALERFLAHGNNQMGGGS